MDNDPVRDLESVLALAKFGRLAMNALGGLRHGEETTEAVLHRVVKQARKTICRYCRGRGRSPFDDSCRDCYGTGEVPYDPRMKVVEDVIGE